MKTTRQNWKYRRLNCTDSYTHTHIVRRAERFKYQAVCDDVIFRFRGVSGLDGAACVGEPLSCAALAQIPSDDIARKSREIYASFSSDSLGSASSDSLSSIQRNFTDKNLRFESARPSFDPSEEISAR